MGTPSRILVLLTAVVAVGCAVGVPGQSGPSESPSRSPAPAQSQAADDFADDVRAAVVVAERYWTQRFAAAERRFQPIRQVVPYRRGGEVTCAGEPIPRNNAVYCPPGDFVAYDINFALTAFERIGDAFVYYLLGHEYAHGIQVRLGIEYRYTIDQELQADCLAGAYLGDSIKQGWLTLEPNDLDEFANGLLAVGDDPSVPWFTPGAHGTARQRTDAFFAGYGRSLVACQLRT
jgi:hypothetical protein